MLNAEEELLFVTIFCVFVIDDANEELLLFTVVDNVSTRDAMEEEKVVFTEPTLLIDAAREELLD